MQVQEQQQTKYENSYKFFSLIPKSQRKSYYQTVFATKQNSASPPLLFHKQYPSQDKFTYQNYKLHYYKLENTDKPRAIIVHFHGLNSHGGRSGYYADIISKHNQEVNIYALDQMNFGMSQGPCRGFISSLDDIVSQGEAFIDYLLTKFQEKPKIFLNGSSFGATIIFKMAINQPSKYNGVILLTPAIRDLAESQPYLKKLNNFLAWIIPKTHIPLPVSTSKSTKYNCDELVKNDPNYESGVVPGSISALLKAMDEVSKMYSLFSVPYIVLQGGCDKSVDLFAPIDLQQESPSQDKETIYFKGMWHAVFHEEEIEEISVIVAKWIKKRL